MEISEQVYTSAAQLLDNVSSHLGVVAQTRNFPAEVEADLSAHRSYSLLADDSKSDTASRPRFAVAICGPQRSYLAISRMCIDGADHTGRTKPFAHHLLVSQKELRVNGVSPSAMTRAAKELFRVKWQGAPAWLDDLHFKVQSAALSDAKSPSAIWQKLISPPRMLPCLAGIADTLLDFGESRQPVVLCIPSELADAAIDMMADILALLPPSAQLKCACISHVVDMTDYLRDSALIFTYPETPFLQRCLQRQDPRRPIILDLTRCDTLPEHAIGPYAAVILQCLNNHGFSQASTIASQWDLWGFSPEYKMGFATAIRLSECASKPLPVPELPTVALEMSQLPLNATLQSQVEIWVNNILHESILCLPGDARWTAATQFAVDERWPARVRKIAFDEIAKHSKESLRPVVESIGQNPLSLQSLEHSLAERLLGNLTLTSDAVHLAISQPTEKCLKLAETLMSRSRPTLQEAMKWWREIGAAGANVQQSLAAELVSTLFRSTHNGQELNAIRDTAQQVQPAREFDQAIYLGVLRMHFEASPKSEVRTQLANRIMKTAFQSPNSDSAARELRELLRIDRHAITAQQVEKWLHEVGGSVYELDLRRVAIEMKMISAVPNVTSIPRSPVRHQSPTLNHDGIPISVPLGRPAFAPKVGRRRGVLPPWTIHALALLASGVPIVFLVLRKLWPGRFDDLESMLLIVVAAASAIAWGTSVVTNWSVHADPSSMQRAFMVRWIVAAFLLIVIGLEIFLFRDSLLPFGEYAYGWVQSFLQTPAK